MGVDPPSRLEAVSQEWAGPEAGQKRESANSVQVKKVRRRRGSVSGDERLNGTTGVSLPGFIAGTRGEGFNEHDAGGQGVRAYD